MSNNKMCFRAVRVTVLLIIGLAVAAPVKFVPLQTAATQGSAVVFFAVYQGQLREIVFNPIIFNQVMVNVGSGYNNASGVFTAPEAGVYQFVFSAQLCRGGFNNFWYFVVNKVSKILCHAQVTDGDTTLNTCYFVDSLKRGDQVWVKQNAGSCAWATAVSKTITFSGMLLARDGMSAVGAKYSSCPLARLDTQGTNPHSSADRQTASPHITAVLLVLLFFFFGFSWNNLFIDFINVLPLLLWVLSGCIYRPSKDMHVLGELVTLMAPTK